MPQQKKFSAVPAQAETREDLRKSEEIFKLLVDAVTDYAIFALDTGGHVLTWNKGAERLKGYTESEITGQHFSKFYTAADIQKNHPAEELRLTLENGRYEEEGWRVKKDGSVFWANLVLTQLRDRDGTLVGYTEVVRDLTERRKAEQAQRTEEEKFRLMIESIKDYAIFMLDPSGKVMSWNEGAKRFKGYEDHEIIGQYFSKFYPEEDIRAKKPQMELEVAESVGRFEDEGWRVRKDGTRLWANVVITALRDRSGKLYGFSKVTRDLSERKIAEEELRTAYEGLEVKIKEKTSELEEALKTRDEFLSIASHELKTPITSIKMQIQMAQHRAATSGRASFDFDKLDKALAVTVGQVERLTQLIDDLLDISRIQAGKLSYDFEKTNFSAILNEVLEGFGQQLSVSKSDVKLYVDEELDGYWDRNRLEQVLVNLISNAAKYAVGSSIVIFAKRDGAKALISVQDFGPGIPKQKRGKIFERFERLGQSRNISGLGLGLYISKQIVLAHGGTIHLKPGEEKGATFVVSLPIDSRPLIR